MCKGLLFRFVLVVLHFPAYTVPLFLHRCSSVRQSLMENQGRTTKHFNLCKLTDVYSSSRHRDHNPAFPININQQDQLN